MGLCKKVVDSSEDDLVWEGLDVDVDVDDAKQQPQVTSISATHADVQQHPANIPTHRLAYSTVGTPDYISPEVLAAVVGGFMPTMSLNLHRSIGYFEERLRDGLRLVEPWHHTLRGLNENLLLLTSILLLLFRRCCCYCCCCFDKHQCLVGHTPFFDKTPVDTCRRILRWEHFYSLPREVASVVTPECSNFLGCLITGSSQRYTMIG